LKKYLKRVFQLITHRSVLVSVSLLLQVAVLIAVTTRFSRYFIYFYAFSIVISLAVVLWLMNSNYNPAFKIAWIVPILLFPIFGGIFYLLLGGNRLSRKTKRRMLGIQRKTACTLPSNDHLINRIAHKDPYGAQTLHYIQKYAYSAPCENSWSKYYALGDLAFPDMLDALRRAEHYIFLEYFIIGDGVMWNSILEILKEKVRMGVDVRVIYDDFGCLMTLPHDYSAQLKKLGIRCHVFNPLLPFLSLHYNNRDHRKIMVVDGLIAFTGGINLADEYINKKERFGHWKDTAVQMQGDAAWNLTVHFLSMWDYLDSVDENFEEFRPHQSPPHLPQKGVLQPFVDNPLDDEPVGETVYLNLINKATRYLYINTPYLIIDNEVLTALCAAAKNGVDVRICTPHIPDKWYVHSVTRAYYETLVRHGVKIYEYTPGFDHAKTFVSDDIISVIGTINLDYRSLYLHFECGVLLYNAPSVLEVRDDFLTTLHQCTQITLTDCRSVRLLRRLGRAVLRTLAPLM